MRSYARPVPDKAAMSVTAFLDDDAGYLAWTRAHPAGFVLNAHRNPGASYLKLHRATCHTVTGNPARGTVWTRAYSKHCSEDRLELVRWARERAGAEPDACPLCEPT